MFHTITVVGVPVVKAAGKVFVEGTQYRYSPDISAEFIKRAPENVIVIADNGELIHRPTPAFQLKVSGLAEATTTLNTAQSVFVEAERKTKTAVPEPVVEVVLVVEEAAATPPAVAEPTPAPITPEVPVIDNCEALVMGAAPKLTPEDLTNLMSIPVGEWTLEYIQGATNVKAKVAKAILAAVAPIK